KRTRWTKFYLDPGSMTLTTKKPSGVMQLKFAAMGDGLTFLTPPLAKETEITGPSALKLYASLDARRGFLHRAARVHRRPQGDRVSGRNRPAHPRRAGMAACVASQAR